MDFFDRLAAQRRKFIEGLDANQGDINLDIFEDFYPDEAHFVFELMQNAEDAGATEVRINLASDRCVFQHNGSKPFTEDDIRAITGIHNSTKAKQPDRIGKFGVGFKSVFVYSLRPVIHSKTFSFAISRLVLPERVEPDSDIGTWTRFELPFNNPRKPSARAFADIKAALESLPATTLLYLPNLKSISWKISGGVAGQITRIQHSSYHFEMVGRIGDRVASSSHFLRFEESVKGMEKLRVAVAFSLDFLPGVELFDAKSPLAKQLKIVPATPGHVAVFFPAEKETSGLRFHLNAPFVPELSRASIKDTPANTPLFDQLAALSAGSLHQIRDLGLLTVDFLSTLPNPHDQIPERYQCIREAIVDEMDNKPLTPTYLKGHAPARHLLQAKASIKDLLSSDDIEFLVEYDEIPPQWAVGAPQKNGNADRFLGGLAIKEWDVDELVAYLASALGEGSRYVSNSLRWITGPDQPALDWIIRHPVEWHQKLYAVLYSELSPVGGHHRLKGARIVRLSDGSYSIGAGCFFPDDDQDRADDLPRVAAGVLTSGKAKAQQENARKFLDAIGVRVVGEREQVEVILSRRYQSSDFDPRQEDLARFIALVEKDTTAASLFTKYFIFKRADGKWGTPALVYLDEPFLRSGLHAYYRPLANKADRVPISDSYAHLGIDLGRIAKFAIAVGIQSELKPELTNCSDNPQRDYLRGAPGYRYTSSAIDADYHFPHLGDALLEPSLTLSGLIWRAMCSASDIHLQARFRYNRSSGSRYADSQLVHQLSAARWVPQRDGSFVTPREATRDLLPAGFAFDPDWKWIGALQFGADTAKRVEEQRQKQAIAKELGFADPGALERAKRFSELPPEEQERILVELERHTETELPDEELRDPARRRGRVAADAGDAPERLSAERVRSVSVGLGKVKEEAAAYLRQRYTNADGEMICQICKDGLPFKLANGNGYFEKVEFLRGLKKRHYQNYLALCPNHAAMFEHANPVRDELREQFSELDENHLSLTLAGEDSSIYFNRTHILDLHAVIEVDSQQEHDVQDADSFAEEIVRQVLLDVALRAE